MFIKCSIFRLFTFIQPSFTHPNLVQTTFVRYYTVEQRRRNRSTVYYCAAGILGTLGMAYASVPLYRMLCSAFSWGGTVQVDAGGEKVANMKTVNHRLIKIRFNADTGAAMRWNFKPQQLDVLVHPGETALAFYTAKNPTNNPVIGISTYNVVPYEAGKYFNKIQCFCFEEQMLDPLEEVDLPVFFYIDPEYAFDPLLEGVDDITLSYTFFESKDASKLLTLFKSN